MKKDSIKIVPNAKRLNDNLEITFEVLINGNLETWFYSRAEAEEYAKDWAATYGE